MGYSWEHDPETDGWRHLPHYPEIWISVLSLDKSDSEIKQSRDLKDLWRKIDLVQIRIDFIIS